MLCGQTSEAPKPQQKKKQRKVLFSSLDMFTIIPKKQQKAERTEKKAVETSVKHWF